MTDKAANLNTARTVEELEALTGSVVGVSSWIIVDQRRINEFACVTEDHQSIHVDAEAAASTTFRGTIAHGFLSLSLLSKMAETGLAPVAGTSTSLNYGFDRVRFLTPVPSGSRLRGNFVLGRVTRKGARVLFQYRVAVEIEGSVRPALLADWLVMTIADNEETPQ